MAVCQTRRSLKSHCANFLYCITDLAVRRKTSDYSGPCEQISVCPRSGPHRAGTNSRSRGKPSASVANVAHGTSNRASSGITDGTASCAPKRRRRRERIPFPELGQSGVTGADPRAGLGLRQMPAPRAHAHANRLRRGQSGCRADVHRRSAGSGRRPARRTFRWTSRTIVDQDHQGDGLPARATFTSRTS